MTVADLWKQYQPQIAAAREVDRREAQVALVSAPVQIGREWLMPMTLSRLLYLEAVEHPLLTGDIPTRDQVIDFLWIMSPQFKAGDRKGAKKFFRRFWFRRLKPEPFMEYLRKEFANDSGNDDGKPPQAQWASQIVDVLASEYGWSEPDIFSIPLKRMFRYTEAMVIRHAGENAPAPASPRADKLKHEFMREANSLPKAEEVETTRTE